LIVIIKKKSTQQRRRGKAHQSCARVSGDYSGEKKRGELRGIEDPKSRRRGSGLREGVGGEIQNLKEK